jgi:hypothetical protein
MLPEMFSYAVTSVVDAMPPAMLAPSKPTSEIDARASRTANRKAASRRPFHIL